MPMIDVFAPANMFPDDADRAIGQELTNAVLRAEGVKSPSPFHLDNTAAFIHRMPESAVQTAASASARVVRVQIITPPGVLSREGQKALVKEATEIVAKHATDPDQSKRTWVLLSEASEGGWGISATAFGKEEFGALAVRAKAPQAG
jgi:phenylpyruvate tautomerase PptA (4-oxalocrotonate tautomerase family)